ncbi:MAG TPA: propanediol utilization protein, partial [Firmicutes bacterium]|nr:propanediol utilization protein [Bacillota bacterium]
VGGERGVTFENVLVRVRNDFVLEMHIDTDEANASMLGNGQLVEVFRN